MLTRYRAQPPFETKDGSEIRELKHPRVRGNHKQSLAQGTRCARCNHGAALAQDQRTAVPGDRRERLMTLGDEPFEILLGDTVAIAPQTAHCVQNIGDEILVILCCCSPPYADDDTELL